MVLNGLIQSVVEFNTGKIPVQKNERVLRRNQS